MNNIVEHFIIDHELKLIVIPKVIRIFFFGRGWSMIHTVRSYVNINISEFIKFHTEICDLLCD